jgi:predicted AAA+ superfamily ATPase
MISKTLWGNIIKDSQEKQYPDIVNLQIITWDYEADEIVNGKKIRYVPLSEWLLST